MQDQDANPPPGAAAGPVTSEKRRRRPPLACIDCRRRKVRCDRKIPCQNCVRARRANTCAYVPDDRIEPRRASSQPPAAASTSHDAVPPFPTPRATGTPPSRPNADADPSAAAALAERVRQLEQRLAHHAPRHATSSRDSATSPTSSHHSHTPSKRPEAADFLGNEYWHLPDNPPRASVFETVKDVSGAPRVMIAKNRYFGSSHWLHGVVLFPRSSFLISLLENTTIDKSSDSYRAIAEAKAVARSIKAARIPRLQSTEFGQHVPPRDLADSLLEAYFRTFESVYRILHVPSFRAEYARYWQNPKAARGAFVIQLQLCLALGAVLRDETFSLRNLAVRWIYEARMWIIMQPAEKSRANLTSVQVRCLIHFARQVCGVSPDLNWCEAGALMRVAFYIGLHRDPQKLPKMSLLAAETRRRLWATILEILAESSVEGGGPPLASDHDHDVQPPGNYNDQDLVGDDDAAGQAPPPHPVGTFTDASVQIALLGTLPIRLQIVTYLNQFRSVTSYDKTLLLNSELTTASRMLETLLRVYQSQSPTSLAFQLCETEHVTQRYFLALHMPWLSLARNDPRYFLSRKLCVEVSLRNLNMAKAHGFLGSANGAEPDEFGRLLICASGSHRYAGTQCLIILTIHLFWGLEEHRQTLKDLGVTMPPSTPLVSSPGVGVSSDEVQGHEMLEKLRDSARWLRCRIQAGEVNVKGYLFGRAMFAELEGLYRGLGDDELRNLVIEETREATADALGIVKGLHALIPPGDDGDGDGAVAAAPSTAIAGGGATAQAAAVHGAQFPTASESYGTMDPGTSGPGEMSNWEWDMLQDPNFNLNIRLGGMELMFGDMLTY